MMGITDVHHLPQHTITKNGVRITCPIIVKVTSCSDKNPIVRSLKYLKPHNKESKRKFGSNAKSFFITEHLPHQLQQQKNRLHIFKKAMKAGRKVFWKIERATYCLCMDSIKYHKDNSDSDSSSSDSCANRECFVVLCYILILTASFIVCSLQSWSKHANFEQKQINKDWQLLHLSKQSKKLSRLQALAVKEYDKTK